MKWLVLGLLVLNSAWAENSKIVPALVEAAKLYVSGSKVSDESLFLRPDIRAALVVLKHSQIEKSVLKRRISFEKNTWPLRADDVFDEWVKNPTVSSAPAPEMAMHAVQLKVVEASDDWFRDDIYAYYFVTDGVIPTGKVTTIYKGLAAGQSFFFNEIDRVIFPLSGVPAKSPENHLIVDYGIIESDGDDTKELQKLSTIIIDIAIAVYSSYDPQNAQILINLRKEIKALAELLLSLNHDDRLATGSFGYKADELTQILSENTYVEVTKKHKSEAWLDSWEYHLTFRLLRK